MSQTLANQKVAKRLMILVLGMFAFGFALVPLYNVMCKQLGISSKVDAKASLAQGIDSSRTIKVLLATNNDNLPWVFKPNLNSITLHPGENTRISFHAQNNTDHPMTVQQSLVLHQAWLHNISERLRFLFYTTNFVWP